MYLGSKNFLKVDQPIGARTPSILLGSDSTWVPKRGTEVVAKKEGVNRVYLPLMVEGGNLMLFFSCISFTAYPDSVLVRL